MQPVRHVLCWAWTAAPTSIPKNQSEITQIEDSQCIKTSYNLSTEYQEEHSSEYILLLAAQAIFDSIFTIWLLTCNLNRTEFMIVEKEVSRTTSWKQNFQSSYLYSFKGIRRAEFQSFCPHRRKQTNQEKERFRLLCTICEAGSQVACAASELWGADYTEAVVIDRSGLMLHILCCFDL